MGRGVAAGSGLLWRIVLVLALAFNLISVGWWCWNFYSFMQYPNMTIIMTEPNKLIATIEFLVSAAVVLVDFCLLLMFGLGGRLR